HHTTSRNRWLARRNRGRHRSLFIARTTTIIVRIVRRSISLSGDVNTAWFRSEPSPGTTKSCFAYRMYSDTINAFHPAPQAVMLPVKRDGVLAGNRRRLQYVRPRRPNDRAASFRSSGMLRTAAMRLNSRYHCMLKSAMRMAANWAAAPKDAVTTSAKRTITGRSAAAGREAHSSRAGDRHREERWLPQG